MAKIGKKELLEKVASELNLPKKEVQSVIKNIRNNCKRS